MSLFLFYAVLFVVMLMLPFLVAATMYKKEDKAALYIKNDNVRDPRYFSKSFRAMLEKALKTYDGSGYITLSKKDKLNTGDFAEGEVEGISYTDLPFTEENAHAFMGEFYAKDDAKFARETSLRALAGVKNLTLGEDNEVVRWVDAEKTLVCGNGSELGVSASAAQKMKLGVDCLFMRLYAQAIYIGLDAPELAFTPVQQPKETGFETVDEVDEDEIITTVMICRGGLTIGKNARILGSVKSTGNIHVQSGAQIQGSLVADGNIIFEENSFVGGVVFSQGSVFLGRNCQIGRPHGIKSLIAKENITLCEGSRIYGYASCERGGRTVNYDDYLEIIGEEY